MHMRDWVFLIGLPVEILSPDSIFLSYNNAMIYMISESILPLTVRSDQLDRGRRFKTLSGLEYSLNTCPAEVIIQLSIRFLPVSGKKDEKAKTYRAPVLLHVGQLLVLILMLEAVAPAPF